MKKLKIGATFLCIIIICCLTKNLGLLLNYLLALFLHEMAHLLVAASKGYSLKRIKLDLFGVAVDLNEKIDDKDQFLINIAGPVCNLLICVFCLAIYWLMPTSYVYLNTFCFCNLILAIFNLLPVYPLDGSKIFRGMIKKDKLYFRLNIVIKLSLAFISICAFVISCKIKPNLFFILLSIFFLTGKTDKTPTMSIFKYRKNKHFDKVVVLKVDEKETLFNLIKQIKSNHYTIFYSPKLNRYFDEDAVVDLSLNYPLPTQLNDL